MANRSRTGPDTPSTQLPRYTPPPLPPFAQRALARSVEGAQSPAPSRATHAPPEGTFAPATPTVLVAPAVPPPSPAAFPRSRAGQQPVTTAALPVTSGVATGGDNFEQSATCDHDHGHQHHGHDHADGHHDHGGCDHDHGILGGHTHDYSHLAVGAENRSLLRTALLIQFVFLIAEIAGGIAFHSLALLSDAAHMLADVAAIALALAAAHIALGRLKNKDGHARAELLAASINGYTLLAATAIITVEGFRRLANPPDVLAGGTLVIAVVGLLANVATALVLMRADQNNVNIRATLAHTVTDAISSVGVIAVAALIAITGAHILDPIVSLILAVVIGRMAWTVTREATSGLRSWIPITQPA